VPYFDTRERRIVMGVSFSLGILLFLSLILNRVYMPSPPYWLPLTQHINNSIAFALLLALSFPAAIEMLNSAWLNGVERNIPRLLRDVSEGVQSGIPLLTALEAASRRDYGPISKPLEAAMVRFQLTSDVAGSLNWLGAELRRNVAKRMATVLTEAYASGGRVNDVLRTSVDLFSSIADYKEERRTQTTPYVLIVYLGTMVFFAISWVLLVQFLAPLAAKSQDPLIQQSGFLRNMLDIQYYKSVLFWACAMESLLGGLVAGKISEGRVAAGLIHSVTLILMTLLFFNSIAVG
jgi:flagellar protein FlaJ